MKRDRFMLNSYIELDTYEDGILVLSEKTPFGDCIELDEEATKNLRNFIIREFLEKEIKSFQHEPIIYCYLKQKMKELEG